MEFSIINLINIIIALGIFNVWIIRFNKKTDFRGGNALNLKEEFKVYGLPKWFMYLIGFLKLSFALILILGIWFKSISIYAIYGMTILMIGAILMHLKVNDPFKKYVPALSILILLATLIINY
tara:strand:+ start:1340 stop:1708 length:369 start_codon:yes stop_codon:yes gene_type:complete